MNILITGGTGFVGSHMIDYILSNQSDVKIYATKRWLEDTKNIDHINDTRFEIIDCDLLDGFSVQRAVEISKPDKVFHFAAQSFPEVSFKIPVITLQTNTIGTTHLLESIKNSKYNLIRLPFLLPKNIFDKNYLPRQYKLLMSFIDLPFISFVPPSRNIYRPINVQDIVDIIISKISTNENNKTININGPREMNLLEIAKLVLSKNKKRNKNIVLAIPFPWKILDFFLSKFPYLLNIFERNTILQQLLPIKRF